MSKLFALKEWVTLKEGAAHLSVVFNEPVSVADLYRFALSGALQLSANFVNHGKANLGREMPMREAGFRLMPGIVQADAVTTVDFGGDALPEFEAWIEADPQRGEWLRATEPRSKFVMLNGLQVSATTCIQFEEGVSSIEGVWDLTLRGADRLDVEQALQAEVGGPDVELINISGVLLSRADGVFARLLEHFAENEHATENMKARKWNDPRAYYPAGEIPSDAPVVVRPSALNDFIARASGESSLTNSAAGKPARLRSDRETNLLRVIAGLWALAEISDRPATAADRVSALCASWGWEKPDQRTIAETILAEAAKLPKSRS